MPSCVAQRRVAAFLHRKPAASVGVATGLALHLLTTWGPWSSDWRAMTSLDTLCHVRPPAMPWTRTASFSSTASPLMPRQGSSS
ncbi:unnamed protein product [Symbiodinium natans]|uniref:Uncharacterized protein n=1 Tax=Symbiodinium natans TaxID=878477 RepID=A0A812PBP1_9DINO|nr:unnamed protein product [Symbiodinium natans]